MSNSFKNPGYDSEDKYFHDADLEKIKAIRESREANKKALEKKCTG